jgi:opacity protein-like surface antigen
MIRRILSVAAAVLALALVAGPVHAAADGVTIDGSLILATEPAGGYDSTVGIGVGALIDMSSRMKTSSKDMKLGLRGDLAYFDWDGNFYGVGVSYWRLMFFGGPRLTFQPGGRSDIAPYVEGGLELGYGEAETVVPGVGRSSSTQIDLGLAGGGGVDFYLSKNVKLGVNARLHIISDSFLTIGFTLGTVF